jgi:dihydroorotase (multifunctional complex type)
MPNNEPVTMSVDTLKERMGIAYRKVIVNVGFYSEFPRRFSEVEDVVSEGAIAFKLFLGSQIGGLDIDEDEDLQSAFKEAAKSKVPVAVHAEDRALLAANEEKLRMAREDGLAAFQEAHSEKVELAAIERVLRIGASTDVHLHFCHVSTRNGLDAIIAAKKLGRNVTCEVTPNHILLSVSDLDQYGQLVIMAPPLRSKEHVEALWKGLEDGWVDSLGSDHAPHALKEKSASSVWDVKVGVPGLETTLPLILTLVRKNRLSLNQAVQLLAEKPAEIYGLSDRGSLELGKNADLTVVDFNLKFKVDASKFKSKAKYSPYDGWEVFGKPTKTFANGLLVFDEGEIVAKAGSGSIVRRGSV